jgi:hypothetical protein
MFNVLLEVNECNIPISIVASLQPTLHRLLLTVSYLFILRCIVFDLIYFDLIYLFTFNFQHSYVSVSNIIGFLNGNACKQAVKNWYRKT